MSAVPERLKKIALGEKVAGKVYREMDEARMVLEGL